MNNLFGSTGRGFRQSELRYGATFHQMRSYNVGLMIAWGEKVTGTYRTFIKMAALGTLLSAAPALSQYAPVDPMPLGQTSTSTMANKISGDIASGRSKSNEVSRRCYDDSGPGPERRAMEAEYAKRLRTTGKAGADTWRAAHGRAYRAKLIKSGKCPASALDGRRP